MADQFLLKTKREYEEHLQSLIQEEAYEEGLAYLDDIEDRVVDTTWLNFHRGLLYNALSQPDIALAYLNKARQQSGLNQAVFSELGWTYNRLEEFDEAIFYLEDVLEMGRFDAWLVSELAYSYLKMGMFEEALDLLKDGVVQGIEDAWILGQLAFVYQQLNQPQEAVIILQRMMDLDVASKEDVQELILTYEYLGQYDHHEEILQEYLNRFDDVHFACYHLAVYYNMMRSPDLAIEQLLKLEEKQPEEILELGYSYRLKEDYKLALDLYLEAYQDLKNHLFLISELIYVYGVLNEFDLKLHFLDEAVKLGRQDMWVYLNYVRVYLYEKKDLSLARHYLDHCQELNEQDEEYLFLEIEYLHMSSQFELAYLNTLAILTRRLPLVFDQEVYELMIPWQDMRPVNILHLERIFDFMQGMAYVEDDQHSGFIDHEGNLVIDMVYDKDPSKSQETFMFYQDNAIIMKNGFYGLIDTKGNTLEEAMYDDIIKKDGWVKLTIGETSIFKNGQIEWSEHVPCKMMSEGLLSKKEEKWGYCDTDQQWVIAPLYEEADDFKDGYARVAKDNKYGFIDREGNPVFDFQYEDVKYLGEGYFGLKKEDSWQIVTKEKVLSEGYEALGSYREGFVAVKKNDQWGYYSLTDQSFIECQFDEVLPFIEGCARVCKQGLYGLIDTRGKWIAPCIYDAMTIARQGIVIVGTGYRYGYMDTMGHFLTPIAFQTATLPAEGIVSVSYQDQFYFMDQDVLEKRINLYKVGGMGEDVD